MGAERAAGPRHAQPAAVPRTESPGKRGLWLIISTKMQPIDHMSTGVE